MKFFEVFKVIKNFLGDGVNDVFRYLGGGDKSRLDTKGVDIGVVLGTRIKLNRHLRFGIIRIVGNELINSGTGDRHNANFAGAGSRFFNGAAGMTDRIEEGIDAAVLQQTGSFGSLDTFGR